MGKERKREVRGEWKEERRKIKEGSNDEGRGGEGRRGNYWKRCGSGGREGKGRTYDTTTTALTLLRASSIER